MRLGSLYFKIGHLICLLTIVSLAVYIFLMLEKGKTGKILSPELISTFNNSSPLAKMVSSGMLEAINDEALRYKSEINQSYQQHAQNILAQADSINVLIDSLAKKPAVLLTKIVLEKLKSHSKYINKWVDNDPLVADFFSKMPHPDTIALGFDQQTNTEAQHQRQLALSLMRNIVNHQTYIGLRYCRLKIGTAIICNFWPPIPSINVAQVNPIVGEKIDVSVFFSEYSDIFIHDTIEYWLNGEKQMDKDGIVNFKTRYSKPGVYPINFKIQVSDWLTDSVRVSEKTYFVRVQE